MNTNFLLSVLAVSVLGFLGGWALWGYLLEGYYSSNVTEAAKALERSEDDMIFWAMIVGQLSWGFLLTWVIDKTSSRSAAKGAVTGAIIAVFISASFNFFMYSMMDMHTGVSILIVDILINGAFTAVLGAVAGAILGRGGQA